MLVAEQAAEPEDLNEKRKTINEGRKTLTFSALYQRASVLKHPRTLTLTKDDKRRTKDLDLNFNVFRALQRA